MLSDEAMKFMGKIGDSGPAVSWRLCVEVTKLVLGNAERGGEVERARLQRNEAPSPFPTVRRPDLRWCTGCLQRLDW